MQHLDRERPRLTSLLEGLKGCTTDTFRQGIFSATDLGGNVPVFDVKARPPDAPSYRFVVKRDPEALARRAVLERRSPSLLPYLPQLYGVVEGWVVMEHIEGRDVQELTAWLARDPAFRTRWAQQSSQLLLRASQQGFMFPDITLLGHNVMAEKGSGQMRLVEQDAFRESAAPPHEMMAPEVIDALGACQDSGALAGFGYELLRTLSAGGCQLQQLVARHDELARWPQTLVLNGALAQTAQRGHFDAFAAILARGEVARPPDPGDPTLFIGGEAFDPSSREPHTRTAREAYRAGRLQPSAFWPGPLLPGK